MAGKFTLFVLLLLFVSPSVIASVLWLPRNGKFHAGEVCPVLAGVTFLPGLCPVRCYRPDPVCGDDGVTYWCGCADAHCHGTRVANIGFCEVGNVGSGPIQALLLVHIVWLIVLGFSVVFDLL